MCNGCRDETAAAGQVIRSPRAGPRAGRRVEIRGAARGRRGGTDAPEALPGRRCGPSRTLGPASGRAAARRARSPRGHPSRTAAAPPRPRCGATSALARACPRCSETTLGGRRLRALGGGPRPVRHLPRHHGGRPVDRSAVRARPRSRSSIASPSWCRCRTGRVTWRMSCAARTAARTENGVGFRGVNRARGDHRDDAARPPPPRPVGPGRGDRRGDLRLVRGRCPPWARCWRRPSVRAPPPTDGSATRAPERAARERGRAHAARA